MTFWESSQEESELGTVPDWVPREADSKREIKMFPRESFKISTRGGRKLAVMGLSQPRQTRLPADFSGWQQQAFLGGGHGRHISESTTGTHLVWV